MNWVKEKYDILILAFATLLLVSNAAWIAMSRMEPEAVQAGLTAPKDNAIPPVNLDAIRQATALADSPSKWKAPTDLPAGSAERGSLLVSRRYLLKDGKLIDPLAEGSDQLHPPLTNDWLLANGLDYTDMNIKEKDADGDGFSNLEEFEKKTNPNDPKDAPASFNKLKLVGFNSKPFIIKFMNLSKYDSFLEIKSKDELDSVSKTQKIVIEKLPEEKILTNEDLNKLIDNTKETLEQTITNLEIKNIDLKKKKDKKSIEDLRNNEKALDKTKENLFVLLKILPESQKANFSIIKSDLKHILFGYINKNETASIVSDYEFQINIKNEKGRDTTQYCKLGDMIGSTPYKVLKYDAKPGLNGINASGDLSELTVQNTETGDSIVLVYNKEANDPTSFGTFRNLLALGDPDFTHKKGEEFYIKPDTTRKFKLVDITPAKAEIRDISTGDIFSVLSTDSSSP